MGLQKSTKSLWLLAILVFYVTTLPVQAQWSGVYGNEWLDGKYSQEWLKISVSAKGVHRVTLTGNFVGKADQLHLYHRGVEVALISASSSEIEFYGVPNDGASDALLYRPYTGTRMNPYYSWFSDKSAYFLTFSASSVTKLAAMQEAIAISGTPEPYHIQKELTVYSEDYTHDSRTNPVSFALDQSYYDEGKAMTSSAYFKYSGSGNPIYDFSYQLKNVVKDIALKPKIEALINSRTFARHTVKSSVGKSTSDLRAYSPDFVFNTFAPYKKSFELNAATDVVNSDVDVDGNGVFRLESLTPTSDLNSVGVFSIAYIKIEYPQILDMSGKDISYFNFSPTTNSSSRIQINNVANGSRVYDITNAEAPVQLPSTNSGGVLELMAKRNSNQELKIMVTGLGVSNSDLTSVTFTDIRNTEYNYLIVSNNGLFSSAQDYGVYRNSSAGGNYKSLAVKITDVYNQFNYGEPSPVAIRRYVDYMIKDGVTDKHNLLLIGHSTTIPNVMRLNRELPEEVPTYGFPGSDVLLVEGLTAGSAEIPSIPVGRISATNPEQVSNYLNKVKQYESATSDLSWKKRSLHISGGLHDGENTTFANYLSDYDYYITGSPFNGTVSQKIKADKDFGYPSNSLDISSDINAGIGFSAYYGHGGPTQTDNNIGYATDPDRSYSNTGRYPLLYFNGCGVGNIFSGRLSPFPGSSSATLYPLSTDWVVAEDKGAIAVIANSYYAFEYSSKLFIGALHKNLFTSDATRKTIRQIHQAAEKLIMEGYSGARVAASAYDIANNHQSLLQGDPALVLLSTSNPLPVNLSLWKGEVVNESEIKLSWQTSSEKNNSHFTIERSSDGFNFNEIGVVDGKLESNSNINYSFTDSNPYVGNNFYRLGQVDFGDNINNVVFSRIIKVTINENLQFVLSPNPVDDMMQFKLGTSGSIASVRVYDINGKLVINKANTDSISMKKFPAGTYIAEIVSDSGKVFNRKFIKQ